MAVPNNLKLLYVISALDALNFTIMITVFGPYVMSLGGSHSFVGMIMSVGSLISFVWNPIVGSLSDNIGRKTMLLRLIVIIFVSNFLMCLSSSLVVIFIARVISSLGMQLQTILKAFLSELTKTPEEKTTAIGTLGALFGGSFIVGALIGGFLSELENGYTYIFIISSLNNIIGFLLASNLPEDKPKLKKSSSNLSLVQTGALELKKAVTTLTQINWKKFWDIFAFKGCIEFSYAIFQANMGLLLMITYGLSGRYLGLVFTFLGITGILTNILIIKLKRTYYGSDFGYTRLFHGSSLLILAFSGIAATPTISMLLASMAILSISRTLIESTMTEVISSTTADNERASVMTAFENTVALAGFIAPLLSGVVADRYNEQAAILLCVLPSSIACFIAYIHKNKTE